MIWLLSILTIGVILITLHSVFVNEIHLERIEILNSTYSQGVYNFAQIRIDRINHKLYNLQSDVEILIDVDKSWEIESHFYYNRFNNYNYIKTPIQIPRTSLCSSLERFKPWITFDETKNVTNFPKPQFGTRICPIKAVTKTPPYNIIFYLL